jgi:hypothetical protein
MKKYLKTFLLFLVILLLAGIGFWNLKLRNQVTPIQNEKVVQEYKANLVIEDGKNTKSFDISNYIGKTVLEATTAVLNGDIKTNGEGVNAFVTSLNGRTADTKKREFWELDANGTETQVGAGSYVIKNNDKIDWKINTY